ncbi:glycoside hydrolase family 2 TIM barrel-domain containing protein [Seramator thermalis]|uniref:glycoside hydrolase family 2 TIM barrel-domain containing protein n=1 Tax=Seramator thermalis TaxID=2496270 RepID=UPI00101BA1B9|nr:glycoside hydrolase family 2 TIM barrel-domain containing protein [Seramator thermalis]
MKRFFFTLMTLVIVFIGIISCNQGNNNVPDEETQAREVWSAEQAQQWYKQWGWLRGADFIPSTAINQIEMWQAETFDPETIDRELGYAESIGFNSMRVYLHHLAWQIDTAGFKNRMKEYLNIADQHGISTLFVFFDDCWNPTYKAGKQPDPKPGIHNSGWVRDPGDSIFINPAMIGSLEKYVKDILRTFSNDSRIVLWDVYNEPGNSGYGNKSLPLLEKVFEWGREINPSQPLSAGVWNWDLEELCDYQIKNSDIITYHNYGDSIDHKRYIDTLRLLTQKPLICTEYMARTRNSLFKDIMPILKRENIGAYNWGLVAGKTNTIYAWDTPMPDGSEPKIWFHDIFRKDGTPYNKDEIKLIKSLTSKD